MDEEEIVTFSGERIRTDSAQWVTTNSPQWVNTQASQPIYTTVGPPGPPGPMGAQGIQGPQGVLPPEVSEMLNYLVAAQQIILDKLVEVNLQLTDLQEQVDAVKKLAENVTFYGDKS